MKQPVLVRFAYSTHYASVIDIDVSKLTDILKFPTEIFGTVDGIRIAIKREEYENALKNIENDRRSTN